MEALGTTLPGIPGAYSSTQDLALEPDMAPVEVQPPTDTEFAQCSKPVGRKDAALHPVGRKDAALHPVGAARRLARARARAQDHTNTRYQGSYKHAPSNTLPRPAVSAQPGQTPPAPAVSEETPARAAPKSCRRRKLFTPSRLLEPLLSLEEEQGEAARPATPPFPHRMTSPKEGSSSSREKIDSPREALSSSREDLSCQVCGNALIKSLSQLETHVAGHFRTQLNKACLGLYRGLQCLLCGLEAKTTFQLITHIGCKHGRINAILQANSLTPLPCPLASSSQKFDYQAGILRMKEEQGASRADIGEATEISGAQRTSGA